VVRSATSSLISSNSAVPAVCWAAGMVLIMSAVRVCKVELACLTSAAIFCQRLLRSWLPMSSRLACTLRRSGESIGSAYRKIARASVMALPEGKRVPALRLLTLRVKERLRQMLRARMLRMPAPSLAKIKVLIMFIYYGFAADQSLDVADRYVLSCHRRADSPTETLRDRVYSWGRIWCMGRWWTVIPAK
jgi:hypothetical protein